MSLAVLKPKDRDAYYNRMASSLQDKLWFIDRLPVGACTEDKDTPGPTLFADFGCADGRLLREVAKAFPLADTLGYDMEHDALSAARVNCRGYGAMFWTTDLEHFSHKVRSWRLTRGGKTCLILSSVVHEVMSQGTTWDDFWSFARGLNCDYIVVRDMACTFEDKTTAVGMERNWYQGELYDACTALGKPETIADYLQLLLKYRYRDDLQKEASENYFPLTDCQWLNRTTIGSGYSLKHFEHYSVPYLRELWWRELGLYVPNATHIKIMLKRNK